MAESGYDFLLNNILDSNLTEHAQHLDNGEPSAGCLWCDTWRRDLDRATRTYAPAGSKRGSSRGDA